MAARKGTVWELEPHTRIKHAILRRYLQAWFPILNRWNGKILFIDGFCGPGEYSGGEPGSPIIALDVAKEHSERLAGELVFLFVDSDKRRVAHLESILKTCDLPESFTVHTECEEFERKLSEILDSLDARGKGLVPTFAFIDPFGFSGLPFDVVERILSYSRCEVFVNLPVQFINRFANHPNDQIREQIIRCYGTEEILRAEGIDGNRIEFCRLMYQNQLLQHARFVRFFEMRDRGNVPLYYLFFASNHPLGHVKMKEAMWSADPDGEFSFSDRTDPHSIALFNADCTHDVATQLQNGFADVRDVPCLDVRKFIEDTTPYLSKHMKTGLRYLEDEGHVTVNLLKLNGRPRRGRSFPDDVVVSFPAID